MSVILHISDLHFGTEKAAAVAALERLAQQERPDLVLLTGDITQRATVTQFSAARTMMERLGAPFLAIPGNHDIALFDLWERLRQPYARHRAAFGEALEPMHCCAELLVLGVNTTRRYRHVNGEVSAAQIERVATRLAQALPNQLRVIMVHHPLAVTNPAESGNLLRGRVAACQRWAQAGADLVLGGHIHLPYVMAVPKLERALWVVQGGTAVSSRVRPGVPNAVNVLRWTGAANGGICHIEQWNLSANGERFVTSTVTQVRPTRLNDAS